MIESLNCLWAALWLPQRWPCEVGSSFNVCMRTNEETYTQKLIKKHPVWNFRGDVHPASYAAPSACWHSTVSGQCKAPRAYRCIWNEPIDSSLSWMTATTVAEFEAVPKYSIFILFSCHILGLGDNRWDSPPWGSLIVEHDLVIYLNVVMVTLGVWLGLITKDAERNDCATALSGFIFQTLPIYIILTCRERACESRKQRAWQSPWCLRVVAVGELSTYRKYTGLFQKDHGWITMFLHS